MYNQRIPENLLAVIATREIQMKKMKCTGMFYIHNLGDNINTYKITYIYTHLHIYSTTYTMYICR